MKVLRKAFNQPLNEVISEFVSSVKDDAHLITADITGSIAHVHMLAKVGLLTQAQADNLLAGLTALAEQAENGELVLDVEYEDVHMNIEHKLEKLIGNDAKLLHTARSRNDQVALDTRLYVLEQIDTICKQIFSLCEAINAKSSEYADVVMPGYTHLQKAQPLAFPLVMNAFVEMLHRDFDRFMDAKSRTAVSPLGAGALAGSALPIDPAQTASFLGFASHFGNSLDAVTDRDFIAEFIFDCSMTAVHLSQLAETLIIWCTSEFGFVQFSDAVTTTSSLMPQKKNPDPIEIVRAKVGSICGDLMNVLMVLKALPVGYNRDLQETKPPAIHSAATIIDALKVMAIVVSEMTPLGSKTLEAASHPDLMATDLVEYLVLKGVPFRAAHETIAEVVKHSRENGLQLNELSVDVYKKFNENFEADIYDLFDPVQSIAKKTSVKKSQIKELVSI